MDWDLILDEDNENGIWIVVRGDERMVSLTNYELARGIVDRVNAAGLDLSEEDSVL